MNTVILDPTKKWGCPSCGGLHLTREARPHTPFHQCPALNGLTAPYVEIVHGSELDPRTVRHVPIDREDYVGSEDVQTDDNGRPIMALDTQRADGSNDRTVYAPTAHN